MEVYQLFPNILMSWNHTSQTDTENVENFVRYTFSRISHRALDTRKYDVSEKINH